MNIITKALLETTLYSSVMIAAILAMKAVWRGKLGSGIIKFLWVLILVRLLLPVTIESPVHLDMLFPEKPAAAVDVPKPSAEDAPYTTTGDAQPFAYYDGPVTDTAHADYYPQPRAAAPSPSFFERAVDYLKGVSIWSYVFTAWIVGAAALLIKTLGEYLGFRRRVIKSENSSRELTGLLTECKARLKYNKDVSLMVCRYLSTPVTFKIVRPVILLPISFAGQMEKPKLKMILMHELCHIKNRDILRNILWLLAKTIHWFNPLVWAAYKYYLEDVELACDETVIKSLGEKGRFAYSQSLIDVVKLSRTRAKAPAALAFCKDKTKIRKRVENMIEPKKKLKSAGFISLLTAAILIIGCFTTACRPKPDETTDYPAAKNTETQAPEESQEKKAAEEPGEKGDVDITPAYTAVEHTEKEIASDDGTLNVMIDADVQVPETASFPVLKIEAEKITQEKVDAFLNEFFPNRQAIATSEIAQLPTKDNYLKLIAEREEWIKTKEEHPNAQGPTNHEFWQQEIDFYRAQLADAPDINPEIPEYDITKFSSIPLLEVFWDAELTAKELEEQLEASTKRAELNNTQLIQYDIQTDGGKTYGIYALRSDVPYINSFSFRDNKKYYAEYGRENYVNITGLDTTFDEAAATAEKAARLLGLNYMDINYASADAYKQQGEKESRGYSYHFVFTRAVEGANVTYTQNIINNPDVNYDSWSYNYFEIWIDDDGISQITWHSCSSVVTETVSENAALMPYSDVLDIAAQCFRSQGFTHSRNTYGAEQMVEEGRADILENNIIIDKIILGYTMTAEGDSTGEHTLVPVWDFIGRESISMDATNKKDGGKFEVQTEMPEYTDCHSFLTINAVDGTIINRRKGH